jgi:DNA segregation ATPase FtsK/SpoIIIE, S-DNA-T family
MRTTSLKSADYVPEPFRLFLKKRAAEILGLILIVLVTCILLALATWSIHDASLNFATSNPTQNIMGPIGAATADLIMQMTGLGLVALLIPPLSWGIQLLSYQKLNHWRIRLVSWICAILFTSALASLLPTTSHWPLPTGLGGVVGDVFLSLPSYLTINTKIIIPIWGIICAICAILSLNTSATLCRILNPEDYEDDPSPAYISNDDYEDEAGEPNIFLVFIGGVFHAFLMMQSFMMRFILWFKKSREEDSYQNRSENYTYQDRIEPHIIETSEASPSIIEPRASSIRVEMPKKQIKQSKRSLKEQQPSLLKNNDYEHPPLALLTESRKQSIEKVSEDALEQNARLLESVLDDFGVKGDITNVRPGPVVTLYELEPAPGIKSSRVIGLADDIARSMSAISARVAVVQGRNAIGIELPNQKRATVYLRELISAEEFESSKHKLAIALGKTIGGEPIIVDLARMPHLLVAGTTGSGKSVAINTMILSLLYRLRPEECRLIMIDPKMLELSIYDGIPHLLTPVVTDPKKAVVALKWAVKEMEERYKKMSKVGVRNIENFNQRVQEAKSKGQILSRTVQTGFNRETGEAIYEKEEMDLSPLPFIVVIVDEMADLMMVAGKDIEGAIQRLAQMARAAGIHLIMATQRPSVDVITGTIKANFPTRISFQVTSKIDSRTILGEQGAEQLLGQGDMLYMAGGSRIARVHGPFVSDQEVDKVVNYLKTQGAPDYLDAITIEEEHEQAEIFGESPSSDLYDRAVAIVLRDKKCSTSYIQRRLSIGYNKAASLVERMEEEGLVGAANHAGKREILVGSGIDRGAFEPD